jgi:hypothetical protein
VTEEERIEPTLQPAWATVQAPASAPVHAGEGPNKSQRAWFARRPIPIYIICAYCTLQWVAITLFMIEKWSTFVELVRTGALAPVPFAAGFIYPLILFIAGIFLLFMRKAAVLWFALYLLLGLYKVLTQNVSFPGYIDVALIFGVLVYCLRLNQCKQLT